jgi:hypothetical protein
MKPRKTLQFVEGETEAKDFCLLDDSVIPAAPHQLFNLSRTTKAHNWVSQNVEQTHE